MPNTTFAGPMPIVYGTAKVDCHPISLTNRYDGQSIWTYVSSTVSGAEGPQWNPTPTPGYYRVMQNTADFTNSTSRVYMGYPNTTGPRSGVASGFSNGWPDSGWYFHYKPTDEWRIVQYGDNVVVGGMDNRRSAYVIQLDRPLSVTPSAGNLFVMGPPSTGSCAALAYAVCEAPILGIGKFFKDGNDPATNLQYLSALNSGTLAPTFMSSSWTTWGPWETGGASTGQTLSGTVQLRLPLAVLTSEGKVPSLQVEVTGAFSHPRDVIVDLLTNPKYGMGFTSAQVVIDVGPNGLSGSSYKTYCDAMGFNHVSLAITDQSTAQDLLKSLLIETNASSFWSEGQLHVFPMGDVTTGSYTPATSSWAIGDDDYLLEGGDPVTVQQTPESDVFNTWPVSYKDPFYNYESVTVEQPETGEVAKNNIRRAGNYDAQWIDNSGSATQLSQLLARKSLYFRNTYNFKLGPRYGFLDPLDFLTLTESRMGLSNVNVRISRIDEDNDGGLNITAIEWPFGVMHAKATPTQGYDGYKTSAYYYTNPMAVAQAATSVANQVAADILNVSVTASNALNTGSQAQFTASQAWATASTANNTISFITPMAITGVLYRAATDLANVIGGSVTNALLAPGCVTAKNMVIADLENMVLNPNGVVTVNGGINNVTDGWVGLDYAGRATNIWSPLWEDFLYGTGRDMPYGGWFYVRSGDQFWCQFDSIPSGGGTGSCVANMGFHIRYNNPDNSAGEGWTWACSRAQALTGIKTSSGAFVAPADCWLQIMLQQEHPSGTPSTGFYYRNVQCRRMNGGNLIVDGSITTQKITALGLQTADYAEDASGNPTVGAKLLANATTPIKVAPGGLKIGATDLNMLKVLTLNAFDRDSDTSTQRIWYRGNSTGVPVIYDATYGDRVQIKQLTCKDLGSWFGIYQHEITVQPRTKDDNLDALTMVEVSYWTNDTTPGLLDTRIFALGGRSYVNAGTDSDAQNSTKSTIVSMFGTYGKGSSNQMWITTTTTSWQDQFTGWLRVRICNQNGWSGTRDFHGNNTPFANMTNNTTISGQTPVSPTTPTSPSTGGGRNTCVDPDTLVIIDSSGTTVRAGDLKEDTCVWTVPEQGGEPGLFVIYKVVKTTNFKRKVSTEDGRSFTASINHLVKINGEWRRTDSIQVGEVLEGSPDKGPGTVATVEDLGEGDVIQLTIPTARTFFTGGGLLMHNTTYKP